MFKKATATQTPTLKSDQTWAKSNLDKANVFANHLREVFMANPNSAPVDLETTIFNCLDLPIKKFSITEVKTAINKLKCKKSQWIPSYHWQDTLRATKDRSKIPDIFI